MLLSASSIYNTIFFSSMMIVLLWLLLKNRKIISKLKFHLLFLCLALIIIRMLVPVEYCFTITLLSTNVLPVVNNFLYYSISSVHGHDILILHILYFIWFVGSMVNLCKFLSTFFRLQKLIHYTTDTDNAVMKSILSDILSRHKQKKTFRIIQTPLSTPMITGIFHPCILLPNTELSREEATYILEHETAHYFHGDLWIKFAMEILSIIYWWNPLIYLLNKQVSKILEIHIDISVTSNLDEAGQLAYLECLLKIAKQRRKQHLEQTAIPLIGESNSTLSQRFHIVLEQPNKKKPPVWVSFTLFPLFIIAVLSFCVIFEAYSENPQDVYDTFELTEDNAYLVPNAENGYDVYYMDVYQCTISNPESLGVDLPIYQY